MDFITYDPGWIVALLWIIPLQSPPSPPPSANSSHTAARDAREGGIHAMSGLMKWH